MKITIEPTTQIIDVGVECRVWEGTTEDGTRCQLFIARVAVDRDEPAERLARFERELTEQKVPTTVWPLRMIL